MMMAPAPMALVLLLGGCLRAASSAPPVASPPPLREGATFAEFAARYRPQGYSNSTERSHRATVFSANQLAVRRHNAAADSGNHSFWLALNEWADMTHHEWVAKMMLRPTTPPRQAAVGAPSSSPDRKGRQVPAKVDWTSPDTCKQPSGCVTSVKNQGYCGACWAFSAAGAMESAYAIANGKLVNASVQQILDCQAGANACAGGDTQDGVLYAIGNGGLASWEDYPYTSGAAQQVTPCCASPDPAHPYTCLPAKITIDAYDRVPAADEDALMEYVALSPVSVNVNASRELMQFYSYGVYDVDCSPQTDHGVLAVGYGSGGTETMAYDFSQSGRNKTDCGSWCEDCWGNPHCSGCKSMSHQARPCLATLACAMSSRVLTAQS
jgi:cathepsin L